MTWNESTLLELLAELRVRRGDSTTIEVKKAAGGLPKEIDRTVCAFANMPDGGTIIFGVDEKADFAVSGIQQPAAIEAALVDQARKRVDPVPHIKVQTVILNSKPVVVAEVTALPLRNRPAMVEGRAYLRQADGNFVMNDHEIAMIETDKILMAESKDYDKQIVEGLTVADLVPEIVQRYLSSVRSTSRRLADRTDEEILRLTGVVVAGGQPTLAGLYAMGDYPQGYFPSLTVTAAVQLPSDVGGARNRDLQHFTGPIPVLLDELMEWCARNLLPVRAYRHDGHMSEIPEIPLAAVRELIANALVHRDLSPNTLGVGKQIQIRLTPTNLFIVSPGGLRGISLEQLESDDHAQAAVNQHLYSIAKHLTTSEGNPVIEGEGGGIREVFRAADAQGLPRPTLINTGVQFKALVWRPESGSSVSVPDRGKGGEASRELRVEPREPAAKPQVQLDFLASPSTTKNEPMVLQLLGQIGEASFQQLLSQLPLKEGQLRYALRSALESGRVVMLGRQGRKDTRYRLGN